jgi:hypothetical protein
LRFGGPVNHSELTASWVVHKQDVKRAEATKVALEGRR